MLSTNIAEVSPFLAEISERDRTWDLRKKQTSNVALLYKSTQFNRLYERMSFCANQLRFDLISGEQAVNLKLKETFFCRVRHCPICQWRRVRMWFGRFVNTLPKMLEDYPSARFLHLTLTARNCEVKDLRSTLVDMNKAWQRLSQRKEFKGVLGWVKAVEITRNNDPDSPWFNTAHPHFHALLMVKPSYFTGKSYVSHDRWVHTWRQCLRADYDPSVRVQAIKPKNPLPASAFSPLPPEPLNAVPVILDSEGRLLPSPLPQRLPHEMISAISEVVKYAVKPQDLVIGGEWLVTLTEQLRGTKAIALGGVMREYLKEPDEDEDENEDLIVAGLETDEDQGEVTPAVVLFSWRERLRRYRQVAN